MFHLKMSHVKHLLSSKIYLTLGILISAFLISSTSYAQNMGNMHKNSPKTNNTKMMHSSMMEKTGGNMMQGAMMKCMKGKTGMMSRNNPLKKSMMIINKLPGMSKVVSLTKAQKRQLMEKKIDFLKRKIDYKAAIAKEELDLENLFQNNAPSSKIRNVMQRIAKNKIDLSISGYDTAIAMKNLLNAKQKQTLKNMQKTCKMGKSGMHQGGK